MPKYKVIFDREVCIGALACAASSPDFWLRGDDGKADLRSASYNKATDKWELIIDEKDLLTNKEAESVCPVAAIKVVKIE